MAKKKKNIFISLGRMPGLSHICKVMLIWIVWSIRNGKESFLYAWNAEIR